MRSVITEPIKSLLPSTYLFEQILIFVLCEFHSWVYLLPSLSTIAFSWHAVLREWIVKEATKQCLRKSRRSQSLWPLDSHKIFRTTTELSQNRTIFPTFEGSCPKPHCTAPRTILWMKSDEVNCSAIVPTAWTYLEPSHPVQFAHFRTCREEDRGT